MSQPQEESKNEVNWADAEYLRTEFRERWFKPIGRVDQCVLTFLTNLDLKAHNLRDAIVESNAHNAKQIEAHERRLNDHMHRNKAAADELTGMSGRLDAIRNGTVELRQAVTDIQQRADRHVDRMDAQHQRAERQHRRVESQDKDIQALRAEIDTLRGLLEVSNDRQEQTNKRLAARADASQEAYLLLATKAEELETELGAVGSDSLTAVGRCHDMAFRVEKLEGLETCGIKAAHVHEDPAIQFPAIEAQLRETLRKEFNGYIGERTAAHSKALRKNIDALDSQVHSLRKEINGFLFEKHEVAKRLNVTVQAVRGLQLGWNKMIPDVVQLGADRDQAKEAIGGQVVMLKDLNERLLDVEQDMTGLMDDFYTEIPDGVSIEEFAAELIAEDAGLCDQAEEEQPEPVEHPLIQLMREFPGTMEYVVRLVGASPVDAKPLLDGIVTDNLRAKAKQFKAFTFKE